jgi:hypothetical protein
VREFLPQTGGLPMLNPRNMYSMGQYEEVSNKYNDSGFHKIDEKKIDYRQNMNSKLDNFIFDNPNALPPNPILQQNNNQNPYGQSKDTRMVIQDSNKDYYRQSANDRMSTYSPLSRASNMPISIASMSVNDFYSNMQGNQLFPSNNNQSSEPTNKDAMNSRMDNYTPLAKTIQYQTQNVPQNINNLSSVPQLQKSQMLQTQQQPMKESMKASAPIWNSNDVNGKLNNVVFKDLPMVSNLVR